MTRAAIALGSNLGDRLTQMRTAVGRLARLGTLVAASPLYETAPIGGPEQGAFYNAVVVLDTRLEPRHLLDELHLIEAEAGRVREVRWGPRLLDLDLILYGTRSIEEDGMIVPHPRFSERRFVLEPLVAAWPEATTPDGVPIAEALARVADQEITMLEGVEWVDADLLGEPAMLTEPARQAPADHSSFGARGGWWVAAQALILGAAGLSLWLGRGTLGEARWVPVLGVVVLLAGVVEAGLGVANLGANLTPYPEPRRTGALVHWGIYRLARHPIYGGIALGMLGAALLWQSLPALLLALAGGAFFWVKAGLEERRLLRTYPGYAAYRDTTRRRMIPWLL